MGLGLEELCRGLRWRSVPLPELYMGAVLILTLSVWSNLFLWLQSRLTQLLEGLEAENYFLANASEDEISDWLNNTPDSDDDLEDLFEDDD